MRGFFPESLHAMQTAQHSVETGSYVVSTCSGLMCAALHWLNVNADAIVAFTALGGFAIALVSGGLGVYLTWLRIRKEQGRR